MAESRCGALMCRISKREHVCRFLPLETAGIFSRRRHCKRDTIFCRETSSFRKRASARQDLHLSLGRVVPAPHTRHLLGLFAAIAQNSLLRSFSIVDSLASRQHSCRGSEELAIRKTARFQATPNYSELLRVRGAQELRATPSYSTLLRATPSYSEPLRAATQSY